MHDLFAANHLFLFMPAVDLLLLAVLSVRLNATAFPVPRGRGLSSVVEERLACARDNGRLCNGREPRRAVELREVEHAEAAVGHLVWVAWRDDAVDCLFEIASRDDYVVPRKSA